MQAQQWQASAGFAHDDAGATDQAGIDHVQDGQSSVAQPECKLVVFPYGAAGLEQADILAATLQKQFLGLELVNGFEAFSSFHQEELSPVGFHRGVVPTVAECWRKQSGTQQASFVQHLQSTDIQQTLVNSKEDFLAEVGENVKSLFWLNSKNRNNAELSILDFNPLSSETACAAELCGDSGIFVNIPLKGPAVVSDAVQLGLRQFLSDPSQRLAVLMSTEEDAAELPTFLDELPAEQTVQLQQLVAQQKGTWQLASLVAVLLQPQDVKLLVESTRNESATVELAVILHLDCKVFITGASVHTVPIDMRLDATAPRVLRGKAQVFSIAGY